MAQAISNSDDTIDSRDVIARIEELEQERDTVAGDDPSAPTSLVALAEWDKTDEGRELTALRALADEASGYAADWLHGEQLIRDSYFRDYAQELAEECGDIDFSKLSWPLTCIDWEQAARELRMDYTSVDFDGVTYWVR